jgi:predicted peptidase
MLELSLPGNNLLAQQKSERLVSTTEFLLYIPEVEDESGKFPLILFLHGSGERGNNLDLVKTHGPPSFLNDTTDFPFVVVSPQCKPGRRWSPQNLLDLLDYVETLTSIDKNRVYLTGLSMGGFGTYDLAMEAPYRFAAIAPICGGGDTARAERIKDIPIWVFHGAKDMAVPIARSEEMVAELKDLNADVQFTVYPELGHDSWTVTYANPELYKWFLSHNLSERNNK